MRAPAEAAGAAAGVRQTAGHTDKSEVTKGCTPHRAFCTSLSFLCCLQPHRSLLYSPQTRLSEEADQQERPTSEQSHSEGFASFKCGTRESSGSHAVHPAPRDCSVPPPADSRRQQGGWRILLTQERELRQIGENPKYDSFCRKQK